MSVDNNNQIVSLIAVLISLAVIIGIFIRIAIKIRKGGGSLTTVMLGATDHFLTKEKSRAAEVIVNQKSDRRLEVEQKDQAGRRGMRLDVRHRKS